MTALRKLVVLFLVLGMVSATAACGRKGPVEAPPDSTYPRDYPTQ